MYANLMQLHCFFLIALVLLFIYALSSSFFKWYILLLFITKKKLNLNIKKNCLTKKFSLTIMSKYTETRFIQRSFVDPVMRVWLPWVDLFRGEPKSNFLLCWFNWVRSMANVSSNINAEVSSDGTWSRIKWICLSKHFSSCGNNWFSFPNHAYNWPR